MESNFDESVVELQKVLDPLISAANSNYKTVKKKNGFERMWIPLFLFYPFKQLVSLITIGQYGMKVSKLQVGAGITGLVATITKFLPIPESWFKWGYDFYHQHSFWQLIIYGLIIWYIVTVIYTFLQMPNWKNEDLFHIDAYRVFRPNEYAIVQPFLGTTFSIESLNNFMLRNSGERAIREIKDMTVEEVNRLQDIVEDMNFTIESYEQNILFLNKILIHLDENIEFIANGTLDYQHLYIMESPFCIYKVKDGQFSLLHKEYPRRSFKDEFNCKDSHMVNEPYVRCYFQTDELILQTDDSYSYKIYIESKDEYWIITFFVNLQDEVTLQEFLENSILLGQSEILQTADIHRILKSHSKIISEKPLVSSK
ncbi:hypothetical protein ACFVR2_01800 [Gottfriedia sp. NPDC057991]|uniref:hypothetical protein n=1 Tax=Gottfriedia sp. NPDC057991 TaxID=3346298 RepID=UPI0036DD0911